MTRLVRSLFPILSAGIGLMLCVVLGEAILRLCPVNSGLKTLPVNSRSPLLRFAPNRPFTYSSGWAFTIVNKGRTNNYGFVNDGDYDAKARTPLLAVVGDSYVQALMVPFAKTIQGRLSSCVENRGRIYSFGAAGAPMSQYLAEAEFARSTFRPNGMVVVVVGNDFDESLLRYKSEPGFHYFQENSSRLVLKRLDLSPSVMAQVIRMSALARYLFFNLNIQNVIATVRTRLSGPTRAPVQFVGNTAASADSQRLADSRHVVDEFLAELPTRSGLDQTQIVLVVDGIRPNLYSDEGMRTAAGTYFDVMRRYLIDVAGRRGFEVIDMQPRFIKRHQRDGSRFEFPSDGHWNGDGHKETAVAVAASAVFARVFGVKCTD